MATGLLAFTLATSACGPTEDPDKTQYVPAVSGGALDDKIGATVENANATILSVKDIDLQYIINRISDSATGQTRQIELIIARSAQDNQILSFLYLGNRPLDQGHVTIYYMPVKPGEVITNNDLVTKIISTDAYLPDPLDFAIEGYYGPKSITGITGSELPEGGIVYLDK